MKLFSWLQQQAKCKIIALLGIAFVIFYAVMVLLTIFFLQTYHGYFDDFIYNVHFFYTPAALYHSLGRLNDELRHLYPIIAAIDLVVAILYASFGTLLTYKIISTVTNKLYYQKLSYLFIGAAVVNIVEDVILSFIVIVYPSQFIWLAWFASALTSTKLICLALGFLVAMMFIIIWVNNAILKKE